MKIFNVDLFYKGVPRFCATNLSKFKMSYLSSYLILEKLFQLSTSLQYFYQKRYKKLVDLKV